MADMNSPELYINRELSWLEFNDRVLRQGCDPEVPLLERLKFLAIVGSNLDEFFMIRVAGLKQQLSAGVGTRDISGLTPDEQLELISRRAHRMTAEHDQAVRECFEKLAEGDLRLPGLHELQPSQQQFADSYFSAEVLPLLTPLAVEKLAPFPALPGLGLNLAVALRPLHEPQPGVSIAIVPIPPSLPHLIALPADRGLSLLRLDKLVSRNVGQLFPEHAVEAAVTFRVTRDADVAIEADEAADLLPAVEKAVRRRGRRAVVRLQLSAAPDSRLREWLVGWAQVGERDVYETDGFLDCGALMGVVGRSGFDNLRDPTWPPQTPADLVGSHDIWDALQKQDVLLLHPYESFEPVVALLDAAANDPSVLAIKQTLYRTSGDSPIIAALARAAERGKQVVVLVELMARFDEARNVGWARRLQDAGCHVIYGIAGYKTHAKALLIIRREARGIRRYVHLSTGNYNDRTAKLYADIGLMTSDADVALDTAAFFNLLTGYSQQVGWRHLVMSPTGLRQRIVELIDRESTAATLDQPGLIMAKLNSLQDQGVIQALYRASAAGVRVLLNVRGICCLRPGLPGVSEGIEVTSIVDRYLEHARLFYFRNGGHEEVYLCSADWMKRNLDGRLELLFPVLDARLRERLKGVLQTCFADNVKAWRLRPDGAYERVAGGGPRVRAQEELYRTACEAARAGAAVPEQFHPLTQPQAPADH